MQSCRGNGNTHGDTHSHFHGHSTPMGWEWEWERFFPCGDFHGDSHRIPMGMGWEWEWKSIPTATVGIIRNYLLTIIKINGVISVGPFVLTATKSGLSPITL